jgi:hypothetical protein
MWLARIYDDGKQHSIGYFEEEEEAARAYDTAARDRQGSGAMLNFPAGGERGVPQKQNSSKYLGVSWHEQRKKWVAQIRYDGKQHYIGCFVDEEEAARAYDRAARDRHGSSAMLNLPQDEGAQTNRQEEGQEGKGQDEEREVVVVGGKEEEEDDDDEGKGDEEEEEEKEGGNDGEVGEGGEGGDQNNHARHEVWRTRAVGANITARNWSSKYRGVSWHKQNKNWQAQIYDDGKQHYIGYFEEEEEAARAYDRAARARLGSGAMLNFPAEGERVVPQNSSKYRGVSWCKKSKNIGNFVDVDEAARAYDTAARARQGSTAGLIFHVEEEEE